ncbi:MAG: AAA family ATPase, partial [Planctomycetaceae bacterium]|nr:AAA family ATPase [Planctomycetaceae bacterium]
MERLFKGEAYRLTGYGTIFGSMNFKTTPYNCSRLKNNYPINNKFVNPFNKKLNNMTPTQFKRLPYGTSDFRRIRTEDYVYVDKTRFIEILELEGNPSQFFIRPRKFGKSLFFSMLSYYYDINCADQFDQLFGDLYIGQHPTPQRNSYAILSFDFSGIDTTNEEKFVTSFSDKVQDAVLFFFHRYKKLFNDVEVFIQQTNTENLGIRALNKAFSVAELNGIKIFVIIDEYDHFANDLIAMGKVRGKDFYKTMIAANGLVRDYYESLKIATKSSVVNRTFITGISPVMLDDLTSGYNIGENLTIDPVYNEMMGFTHEEVLELMKNTGVDANLISIDMESYYNGYLFHKDGQNKVYNPSMILYFFKQILKAGKQPEKIIDPNLTTDYGRLQRLTQNDHNRDILIQIVKDNGIVSEILEKFSIDR